MRLLPLPLNMTERPSAPNDAMALIKMKIIEMNKDFFNMALPSPLLFYNRL